MTNLKFIFPILILFISAVQAYPVEESLIKLEKIAVSSLPDDLIIPDLKSVTLDLKGNLFAFAGKPNGQECFIVKFDQDLKFLKRFSRNGKGPGEVTTSLSSIDDRISVDTNGDVFIVDYNPTRFVVFDNDGNYKKDIPLARENFPESIGHIYEVKFVGNGTLVGLKYRREEPPIGILFTLEPPKIKAQYSFLGKRIYDNYVSDYYGENCIIAEDSYHIVFGDSQIYKFKVYDRGGNLISEVEKKDRVMGFFSDREITDIIENNFTPKSGQSHLQNTILAQLRADKTRFNKVLNGIRKGKNVIRDIMISGDRIYVFPVREDITIKDEQPVEIYNLKGRMEKRGYFRKMPEKIWMNFAFFYDRDEDDNPLILKYKVLEHP